MKNELSLLPLVSSVLMLISLINISILLKSDGMSTFVLLSCAYPLLFIYSKKVIIADTLSGLTYETSVILAVATTCLIQLYLFKFTTTLFISFGIIIIYSGTTFLLFKAIYILFLNIDTKSTI